MFRFPFVAVLSAAFLALCSVPAGAQKDDPPPKPDRYICPNATGPSGIDCYLNALEHLYTMCRQVKSIEIIEFGYGKSEEGVNGAKSEYCVDKHKQSMQRPYQAAMREAANIPAAIVALRELQDVWLKALAELKWQPPETDEQYKSRVAQPYGTFRDGATTVRTAVADAKAKSPVKPLFKPAPKKSGTN
jgi:hypothetical protein